MSAEPSDGVTSPKKRGPFRSRVLVVALGCTLVAGGVAVWWAGWPGAAEPVPVSQASQSAHPTPTTNVAADADPEAEAEAARKLKNDSAVESPASTDDATKAVASFLKVLGSSDSGDAINAPAIEEVAAGAILEELRNTSQELEANGWTLRGASTVKSLTVLSEELTDSPATMTVQACIDSSAVVVTDSENVVIAGEDENRNDSARNIFTLQRSDKVWQVVARTFPDNPAC